MSQGDLAHFIFRDDAFYFASVPQVGPEPALAQRLGAVTCTVAGSHTPDDAGKPVEGAAGFVATGTPIYALKACSPALAIAARWQGREVVFVRQGIGSDLYAVDPVHSIPPGCKTAILRVDPHK